MWRRVERWLMRMLPWLTVTHRYPSIVRVGERFHVPCDIYEDLQRNAPSVSFVPDRYLGYVTSTRWCWQETS